jgi:spore coat polysaccharide biosynthesis protein SpsF
VSPPDVGPISFRPADSADAYALWLWANDLETRGASFGRSPIAWADHVRWLRARLADPQARLFVARDAEDCPIGSVRFDSEDAWRTARLSYVVAPEARGRGYGRSLVERGVAALRAAHPGVRVRAEVVPTNARSVAVFRALGWEEREPGDGGAALHFWTGPSREDQ